MGPVAVTPRAWRLLVPLHVSGSDFSSITNVIIIKQSILVIGCHDKNLIWQMQRTLSKHLAVTDTDVGIKHTHPDAHTHKHIHTYIHI